MDLLSVRELRELIEHPDSPCVSIYMPAHRAEVDREDPIRLRNLLTKARNLLDEAGFRRLKSHGFFDLPNRLLVDGGFWRSQSDGLAVFLSPSMSKCYRLPIGFKELVVAADRFHVKPMMPLFYGDGTFYVLAVSQKKLRLLQCRKHYCGDLGLPEEFVVGIQRAMAAYDFERSIQFHTRTAPAGPGVERAGIYHSQGTGTDEALHKKVILDYLHCVDHGISRLLAGHSAPLVLAAVEFLHPLYRQVNSYPHLVEQGVPGNPDRLNVQQLHEQAWRIVEPIFTGRVEASLATFGNVGAERIALELAKALPAAIGGQVETLFVAANEQQWGKYDPKLAILELHDHEQPGDMDLLDLAAMQTFLHRGSVYLLPRHRMPQAAQIAAVLRPNGRTGVVEPRVVKAAG